MHPAVLPCLAALAPALLTAGEITSRMTAQTFSVPDGSIPYRIHLPPDTGGKLPLVLFLHGAGERGADNEAQLKHGLADILDWCEESGNPAVVVAPQCPAGKSWSPLEHETKYPMKMVAPPQPQQLVIKLLETIIASGTVDPGRIYVTGLSMGGYGTWDLLWRHPTTFAAAVPICGGGRIDKAGEMKSVPVWIFHGAKDKAVPVLQSRRMVKALEKVGAGKVRYTEYPEAGHDSWTATYANPEVLAWLFAQER